MTTMEIAGKIADHAAFNYPKKQSDVRWDLIVECFTLQEIIDQFVVAGDFEASLKKALSYVQLMAEVDL